MPKKPTRSHDGYGWHISNPKGYPRFNCRSTFEFRGVYLHRYEAAKMLGRPLKKDEEVHHRNHNKLDFSQSNLKVVGSQEHGWISARQAFWISVCDIKAEEEFHAVIDEMEKEGVNIRGLGAQA